MINKSPRKRGTFIHGVGASQHLDSSGERIVVEGVDITSLTKDGTFNYEHKSDSPSSIVGKILEAKKILKKEDCENEHHKYFWDKVKMPFLYVAGELFDAVGHKEAENVAAMLRYDEQEPLNDDSKKLINFSIEGSRLEKRGSDITKCIARKITITIVPCNKVCGAELKVDPSEEKSNSSEPTSNKKSFNFINDLIVEKGEKQSSCQIMKSNWGEMGIINEKIKSEKSPQKPLKKQGFRPKRTFTSTTAPNKLKVGDRIISTNPQPKTGVDIYGKPPKEKPSWQKTEEDIKAPQSKSKKAQIKVGTKIEGEHSKTIKRIIEDAKAGKLKPLKHYQKGIAKDHVKEISDYYTRLINMENKAKKDKKIKKKEKIHGHHTLPVGEGVEHTDWHLRNLWENPNSPGGFRTIKDKPAKQHLSDHAKQRAKKKKQKKEFEKSQEKREVPKNKFYYEDKARKAHKKYLDAKKQGADTSEFEKLRDHYKKQAKIQSDKVGETIAPKQKSLTKKIDRPSVARPNRAKRTEFAMQGIKEAKKRLKNKDIDEQEYQKIVSSHAKDLKKSTDKAVEQINLDLKKRKQHKTQRQASERVIQSPGGYKKVSKLPSMGYKDAYRDPQRELTARKRKKTPRRKTILPKRRRRENLYASNFRKALTASAGLGGASPSTKVQGNAIDFSKSERNQVLRVLANESFERFNKKEELVNFLSHRLPNIKDTEILALAKTIAYTREKKNELKLKNLMKADIYDLKSKKKIASHDDINSPQARKKARREERQRNFNELTQNTKPTFNEQMREQVKKPPINNIKAAPHRQIKNDIRYKSPMDNQREKQQERQVPTPENTEKKRTITKIDGRDFVDLPHFVTHMFGAEKGAFPGVNRRTIGKFQIADGGDLVINNIEDLDPKMQARLASVLENDNVFSPHGTTRNIKADVGVKVNSNNDLKKLVEQGKFRKDLYNVITEKGYLSTNQKKAQQKPKSKQIEIDPISQRAEEQIKPAISNHFEQDPILKTLWSAVGRPPINIPKEPKKMTPKYINTFLSNLGMEKNTIKMVKDVLFKKPHMTYRTLHSLGENRKFKDAYALMQGIRKFQENGYKL